MKTVILYESRTGYVKECANYINDHLNIDVVDLMNKDFNIEEYELILIGVPIYEGEIEKETQKFLIKNQYKLLDRTVGIFCAGMNTEEFNVAVQESVPAEVFLHAELVHCGGRVKMDSLKRKDKKIIKKRLGIVEDAQIDNKQKINEFIKWAQLKRTS